MRKIVFLCLALVSLTFFGEAAELNVSVCQDSALLNGLDRQTTGLVVGVEVRPRLELVGKLAYYFEDAQNSWENDFHKSSLLPGFGARYTFLARDEFRAYGFGAVTFEIHSEQHPATDYSFLKTGLDVGLGVAYKLGAGCALIGETGALRSAGRDDSQKWSSILTYNNLGLRFYL